MEMWPPGGEVVETQAADVLSDLERRCLLKHICECHELLLLTLLGAASARDKQPATPEVIGIQEALRIAELQVAQAERLALRLARLVVD